jgi:hypothetical protein
LKMHFTGLSFIIIWRCMVQAAKEKKQKQRKKCFRHCRYGALSDAITHSHGPSENSLWLTTIILSPMWCIPYRPLCKILRLIKGVTHINDLLTLSARHPFQNFSTPCILNVNNTGAKQRSIMK